MGQNAGMARAQAWPEALHNCGDVPHPPALTGVGLLHTLAEMAFFRRQLPLFSWRSLRRARLIINLNLTPMPPSATVCKKPTLVREGRGGAAPPEDSAIT
jgi:hypothetical protein